MSEFLDPYFYGGYAMILGLALLVAAACWIAGRREGER